VCFEPASHYRDWVIGVHGKQKTTESNEICKGKIPLFFLCFLINRLPTIFHKNFTFSFCSGIRIEYRQNHRSLSAVYLPEVAREQGWDHVETLEVIN
jgi:hypothetical protein